jgi:YHS domain-containing protein
MKTILTLIAITSLVLGAPAGGVAAAVKPYPKTICLVTDNKLGSMGTPVRKVYGDQEVKFCCKPCVAKFEKNPARYLAKLP